MGEEGDTLGGAEPVDGGDEDELGGEMGEIAGYAEEVLVLEDLHGWVFLRGDSRGWLRRWGTVGLGGLVGSLLPAVLGVCRSVSLLMEGAQVAACRFGLRSPSRWGE